MAGGRRCDPMTQRAAEYRAGAAAAVITPGESMWLAGWGGRTSPSCGTLTDLHAKALALEDAGGNQRVLVTADLIAVPPEISAAVAAHAGARHGLRRDQVLLCGSHTHCGPE